MRVPRLATAAALLLLAAASAAPAQAQYFGRNRVRYDDFQFQVLQTEHFDLYYYSDEEQAARDVGRMAERWYSRLSHILGHEFDERKSIILYADDADFRQTNITDIGEGTQGVTDALRQRNVLYVGATYGETEHVLGHEMVHQFQYDMAERAGTSQNLYRLPLFIVEGLAEYLTVGREDALTAMWMRDAVIRDDFPTLEGLQRNPRYNEYQYGQPFWAYIGGVYGDESTATLFRRALEMPLDSAITSVTGLEPDTLSLRWANALREQYFPLVAGRSVPVSTAEAIAEARLEDDNELAALPTDLPATPDRRVLAQETGAGALNIAPQVSPDGRYVAFFSEADLFGIDLYLADAETGRIIKKLEESGTDPHFDALRFIESAGTWSPDGRQFAYVVFSGGDNEIALLDVETREVTRRIAVRGVGAIKDPAWSPDGTQIAFAGVKGGITDLYLVDVAGGTVRQLTNDRYADLQPAWHPDGRHIAFVTDRGPGTDFDRLTFAEVRLAILDIDSGEIEVVAPFAGAKHINPAWSPDGQSLYFLSDNDGFNDIYRLDRATGDLYRVTRLLTDVSGIADLSPAFSVSRGTGTVMYAVFEGQKYSVYSIPPERAGGVPAEPAGPEALLAATLPPAAATERSVVQTYLADAQGGLPTTRAFPTREYRPRLSLDYVSQPQVGVGYDPSYSSGFGLSGGVSFLFSDQLSDKVLGVAIAANGTIQDIGGQALYLDRGGRFTYGATVGRVPYIQAFYGLPPASDTSTVQGVGTRYYYRTTVTQASALAQYPLNQTQRFEGELGYRRINYDLEYDRIRTDGVSLYIDGRVDVPEEEFQQDALNLAEGGLAFVGDYSSFGFTSPVRGGRYRLGADAMMGSLNLATVTADYRRYLMLRPPGFPRRFPITLAGRAVHYGRYGPDAESGRLNPLYLGYGALVRGYSSNSFDVPTGGEPDPYDAFVNRLYGSRIGIATVELRMPLLGVPRLGLLTFPYLPTELVFFADAGMAWGRTGLALNLGGLNQQVGSDFSFDKALYSVGASLRINVLGALIVEPYYALPLSRDDVKGVFGINLTPGW